MRKAYIMLGLPGSGKSYWAENFIKGHPNTVCINRDKMREMLAVNYDLYPFGGRESKKWESLTMDIMQRSIEMAVEHQFDIIIDETHLTSRARTRDVQFVEHVATISGEEYDFVYVWCTEKEKNLEYRMETPKGGTKKKWKGVINNMKRIFKDPTDKEVTQAGAQLIKVEQNR